ncbi:MAG: acyltransferase family protein [Acetatifactor sp.]|nr:acyltransferase family protein [Acetatifactor sp.]MDE7352610.1 acyltransferase family protein [Acetatifactor sp.]
MNSVKKREPLPDILRGFAILLVILGHCIQEGSGTAFHENSSYFYDKLYQFLYSFHMPLFMLISGYFAWNGMAKASGPAQRRQLLKRRSLSLLLPVLAWTVFEQLWLFLESGGTAASFSSFPAFIKAFALGLVSTGWFLWAVFWCFLIVYVLHFFFRDSPVLYGLGFLAMFVTPDGLGLGAYKFMFPYFLAGFYFHRFKSRETAASPETPASAQGSREPRIPLRLPKNDWLRIAVPGAVFGVLFLFFDESSMIYLSGYKLIGKDPLLQLSIDLYRMIIGFAGAGFFILLWKKIWELTGKHPFPILRTLGQNSLALYMISGEICLIAGLKLGPLLFPSHLLNLAEAAAVTGISLLLCLLLKRIPVLRLLTGDMGLLLKKDPGSTAS